MFMDNAGSMGGPMVRATGERWGSPVVGVMRRAGFAVLRRIFNSGGTPREDWML
jgi:hypothetical protein